MQPQTAGAIQARDPAQSRLVIGLVQPAEPQGAPALPISWLHRMEVCNALQLLVFQGRHLGQKRVTPKQAAGAATRPINTPIHGGVTGGQRH